jgi:hypothetical protein
LRGVAAALGLSVSAVRGHVRADRLAALQVQGKRGPEYRVCPAVVTAFAAERPQLELATQGNGSAQGNGPAQGDGSAQGYGSTQGDGSAPGDGSQARAGAPARDDVGDLRERLQAATDEVARCKAVGAAAAEHYRDELTRLKDERDAALFRANALTAELEHLRGRGLIGRLFRG